jgi:hypothetical protein
MSLPAVASSLASEPKTKATRIPKPSSARWSSSLRPEVFRTRRWIYLDAEQLDLTGSASATRAARYEPPAPTGVQFPSDAVPEQLVQKADETPQLVPVKRAISTALSSESIQLYALDSQSSSFPARSY